MVFELRRFFVLAGNSNYEKIWQCVWQDRIWKIDNSFKTQHVFTTLIIMVVTTYQFLPACVSTWVQQALVILRFVKFFILDKTKMSVLKALRLAISEFYTNPYYWGRITRDEAESILKNQLNRSYLLKLIPNVILG